MDMRSVEQSGGVVRFKRDRSVLACVFVSVLNVFSWRCFSTETGGGVSGLKTVNKCMAAHRYIYICI